MSYQEGHKGYWLGHKGMNTPNWRGGNLKRKCIECSTIFYTESYRLKIHRGKYCSRKCQAIWRKKNAAGSKSWNWKGGLTLLSNRIRTCFEYRQWRSDVFHRDNFTCVCCGETGGKLNADHINRFSSILQKYEITKFEQALNCAELWDINNGRTLCIICHKNITEMQRMKSSNKLLEIIPRFYSSGRSEER